MRRLQVKIFAAFLCVILLTMVINAAYVRRGTQQEIVTYEERTIQLNMLRMEHWLMGYYAHGEGWDELAVYIQEMEVLSGQRVILTDEFGIVIADSYGEMMNEYFDQYEWPSRYLINPRDREMLGILYLSPEPTIEAEFTRELEESISYALLIGSLIAMGVAVLLTIVLSRAISAPVRVLSESALQIGKGDFSRQVKVKDKGELGELADAFNRMSRDLAQASQQRKNFVADIAHELRTPLTNIKGYLEAMHDNVVEPQSAMQLVEEESDLLSQLVDDLQELALAEAGVLKLSFQRIDVQQIIQQMIKRYQSQIERKQLQLSQLTKQPVYIHADQTRIQQVLQNLLNNAIIHTPEGGSIQISAKKLQSHVEITVTDTGAGMNNEQLSYIFERFYRADPSRARATGGTGLGLTISKSLVEAHKGTISAESIPGKGSSFTVVLPSAGT